jgi:hypothetical protein
MVVWPLVYATPALVPSLPVSVAMLAILGIAAGSLVPMQATIRQERSTARMLPRVVGLSTVTVPVVGPLAVLAVGVLLDAFGVAVMTFLIYPLTAADGRRQGSFSRSPPVAHWVV